MHNIGEVLHYIRRTDRVFKKWTDIQIIEVLDQAVTEDTLVISVDETDAINGFAVAKKDKNTLHVVGIQADDTEVFKKFVNFFRKKFEGFDLTSYRKGKFKQYETECLCHKILSLG